MPVRWIQHLPDGTLRRGDGEPPADGSTVYLVGEAEADSAAIHGGELYREGKKAAPGQHRLALRSGDDLIIDVDAKGKAARKLERKGGKSRGQGR